MYCSCSNKSNYEIISLCDIKKFTDKNGPFSHKGWVQLSISDTLILDSNKPNVEQIQKVYISVTIPSTKIIETPISSTPNAEGMTLTGIKLLIDGFICTKIVYTSLTEEQSVFSSNFTVPFCTYIVIDPNADPFNDKYCIKTCIEDVFLSLIDCKTIFKNVTLFILAEKISITCPTAQPPKENCTINNITPPYPMPSNNLPNDIILNALDDTPIITITLDKLNMKILVNYTNKVTDPSGGDNYFKFTLLQSDGTTEKITNTIGRNETGMNFANNVSNTNFQYGDIINLQYQANSKVIITNFPDKNTPIYNPSGTEIHFKLTPDGLASYIPQPTLGPNEIIIKKIDGSTFGTISFNIKNKTLLLTGFNGEYSSS